MMMMIITIVIIIYNYIDMGKELHAGESPQFASTLLRIVQACDWSLTPDKDLINQIKDDKGRLLVSMLTVHFNEFTEQWDSLPFNTHTYLVSIVKKFLERSILSFIFFFFLSLVTYYLTQGVVN